jgi:hypothetical protein
MQYIRGTVSMPGWLTMLIRMTDLSIIPTVKAKAYVPGNQYFGLAQAISRRKPCCASEEAISTVMLGILSRTGCRITGMRNQVRI